ncbi:hypothetical protein JCM17823_08030 [Halorubrum gandharaense]
MKRRRYLATTAALASVSLSGCSMLGDELDLVSPSVDRGSELVQLTHEYDGDPVAHVSFADRPSAASTRRLRTTIAQPANTTIARTRFQFRPAPADGDSDSLFVRPLRARRSDEIETFREDGWTVIEGREHGQGTVSYELLADFSTAGAEVEPFTVEYEVELAEQGRFGDTLIARYRTTLAFE